MDFIKKKNFVEFQNLILKIDFCWRQLKILSFKNLPWYHMMSHKKFGPDRFSRFDVYWIQTDRQTDRQAKFIYRLQSVRNETIYWIQL